MCKGADAPSCLTAAQVDTAKKTYAGTQAGKQKLWGLEPGSESGWASLSGPQPLGIALETYQYLVYKDPQWDYHKLDPAKDVPAADKALIPIGMDASNADLRPFFSHGGKLIMYHGWADPGIPPGFSVEYYKNVAEKVGQKKAAGEIRLFMVPGMGHCGGGDGPSSFNAMAALIAMGGAEQGAGGDPRLAHDSRTGGSHADFVPLSADRGVPGLRQRGRRGEFRLQGTVGS